MTLYYFPIAQNTVNKTVSDFFSEMYMLVCMCTYFTISRVVISGATAKSCTRKFVPSSHPGPFAVVASSQKRQTKVGTLACFDFL